MGPAVRRRVRWRMGFFFWDRQIFSSHWLTPPPPGAPPHRSWATEIWRQIRRATPRGRRKTHTFRGWRDRGEGKERGGERGGARKCFFFLFFAAVIARPFRRRHTRHDIRHILFFGRTSFFSTPKPAPPNKQTLSTRRPQTRPLRVPLRQSARALATKTAALSNTATHAPAGGAPRLKQGSHEVASPFFEAEPTLKTNFQPCFQPCYLKTKHTPNPVAPPTTLIKNPARLPSAAPRPKFACNPVPSRPLVPAATAPGTRAKIQ